MSAYKIFRVTIYCNGKRALTKCICTLTSETSAKRYCRMMRHRYSAIMGEGVTGTVEDTGRTGDPNDPCWSHR